MNRRSDHGAGNFGRVQDLRDFLTDQFQDVDEFPAVPKAYARFESAMHAHFGVRAGGSEAEPSYLCAWLEYWPLVQNEAGHNLAIDLVGVVNLATRDCCDYNLGCAVLVIVGKVGKESERVVGMIPSRVRLTRLDEIDWPASNARKTSCPVAIEVRSRIVDRKLNELWLHGVRFRSMFDQLPRDVIKDAPIVVNRVPEPGREGIWRVGIPLLYDIPNVECLARGYLTFAMYSEGWLRLALEESEGFSLSGLGMEICPLELDRCAVKGARQ